VDMKATT